MFIAKQKELIVWVADTYEECERVMKGSLSTDYTIEETSEEYINYNGVIITRAEAEVRERQRKDNMTLTPADVERALVDAKDIDFDELIEYISSKFTGVNIKRLKAEFRAKDFYRGAKFGNNRLFDVIGNLLGYTSDDIDYLFENKTFPEKEVEETTEETVEETVEETTETTEE